MAHSDAFLRPADRAPHSSPSACAPRPRRSRPACMLSRRRSAICSDISFRALATLAAADAVIAEDTRVTKTLLAHYGIATPLVAYHEHNAEVMRPHLLARLKAGDGAGAGLRRRHAAGLRSRLQAGAAEALEKGVHVTSVPGPSAVLAALVVAGLPTDRFFFEGFLPHKSGAAPRAPRRAGAPCPARWCFSKSRAAWRRRSPICAAVLGPREAAIARELTKHLRDPCGAARSTSSPRRFAARGAAASGEIVLLVAPPGGRRRRSRRPLSTTRSRASAGSQFSVKDAASVVVRRDRPAAPPGLCAGAAISGGAKGAMSRARRTARAFGLRAEALAAFWLRLKGFRVLARNYSAPSGEIDLIARRGGLMVFVEVKARPSFEAAQVAIDARKIAPDFARRPRLARCQPLGGGLRLARRRGSGRAGAPAPPSSGGLRTRPDRVTSFFSRGSSLLGFLPV